MHVFTQIESKRNVEEAYHKLVVDHDAVISLDISPICWTITQLKVVMKTHKIKYNPIIPIKKANFCARYLEWKRRSVLLFEDTAQEIMREQGAAPPPVEKEDHDDQQEENEDCIAAMFMMN